MLNKRQTTLDLNGPILSFVNQPSSATITNSGIATFVGIATGTFPTQSPTNPAKSTGALSYRWYEKNYGALSDGTISGIGLTVVGSATTSLTVRGTSPLADGLTFFLRTGYTPSAYAQPVGSAVTVGTARSTGDALNDPLESSSVILTVRPDLRVILQPSSITDGSTELFSVFNVSATTTNATDNLISYQWRLNGSNLTDGANVSGSRTNRLSIKQTTAGTYTIDVIISHPTAFPSSVTSSSATLVSVDPRQIIVTERNDVSVVTTVTNVYNLALGPANLLTSAIEKPTGTEPPASTINFIYAPEKDVDVIIEMAASGGSSFQGVQGGQGGWGAIRLTLKKNVEYVYKIGSTDASYGPRGGLISGTPVRGGIGGGGALLYEKGRLIAVLGGGGGAGSAAAGGDGGGFNQPGQRGFGRRGGNGGAAESPSGRGTDLFTANQTGSTVGSCPGGNTGENYFSSRGISDCSDYTSSGKFTTSSGVTFPNSADLNRGFKSGGGGRLNGGWGINGAGGAGGSGAVGGSGSEANSNGGGGASGWADVGKVQVLATSSGVNSGNAYMRIKLYNPNESIPTPPVPAPPNYAIVRWDDSRNSGYKRGDEFTIGGSFQSIPGVYIEGPGGSITSPPFDYSQAFSGYRSGVGGSGLFFAPEDSSSRDVEISYVRYRLFMREFGPREDGDIYLGNRNPDYGGRKGYEIRRYYNPTAYQQGQTTVYTDNKREAFIPFRVEFELLFACGGNGNYRILTAKTSEEWSYYGKRTIEFSSGELARQNRLPTGGNGDDMIFPDYASRTYEYPRIVQIKSDIINLDTGQRNTLNMFSEGTRDTNEKRRGNFMEFGKYIIT